MDSRARRIWIALSAAILFAAWTLTVDQFFDSPPILRHVDAARAETTAGAHDASWEPADLAGWAEWLRCRSPSGPVFGWGVSRGSTNLIQSLAFGAPFTAIGSAFRSGAPGSCCGR
jgi:hypothetical protein